MNEISTLQLITPNNPTTVIEKTKEFLKGGGNWVQLRLKEIEDESLTAIALQIMELKKDFDFTLIINDKVNIAKAVNADGVHVGLLDMPVSKAREILGDNKIIGGTANSLYDIKYHHKQGADYVGLGPFRETKTKENLSPVLGLEGYKELLFNLDNSIPVIGIGGIELEDVSQLLEAGLSGVAVSGAINKENTKELTQQFVQAIKLQNEKA